MPAPDPDLLQRLLDGSLDPEQLREAERHLESDPAWQEALENLSGLPHLTSEFLRPARNSPHDERSEAVLDLIDRLKAAPPVDDSEEWREVLRPPSAHDPDHLLGTLGHYEVLEVIAQGGMGIVFRARDPALDRIVALKALSPRLAANTTAHERFLREARAAAALEHENVLPIYSVHEGKEDGGVPWIAMRFADGPSLEEFLHTHPGPLPLEQLCSIARQAVAALEAAHDRGLVHRDIKPGNILLDGAGSRAWIADFGLARSKTDPTLTYPGMVAGTPQFMAPEQVAGESVDERTDLFSLGAVLFLAATGTPPFPGDTSTVVMENVARARPTLPARARASLPVWFQRLLRLLLAREPAGRPQSAREVAEILDQQQAPRPPLSRRGRALLALGGALILLAASPLLLLAPPIALQANHLLVDDRKPFYNTRAFGLHNSLAEAAAAARPGDTIRIATNRPVRLRAGLRIPPGGDLTVQAAEGYEPILDATDCPEAAVLCEGHLRFERLTIQNLRRGPSPLLVLQDGQLVLDHCRLIVEGERGRPQRTQAIEVHPGTHLLVRDSSILSSWSFVAAIPHQEPNEKNTRIEFQNAIVTGYALVAINGLPQSELHLAISRTIFSGPATLFPTPNRPLPTVRATVDRSVFGSSAALWWTPRQSMRDFRQRIHWTGTDNLFDQLIAFVRTTRTPDSRSGAAAVASLADWQALPGVESTGSRTAPLWNARDAEGKLPADPLEVTGAHLQAIAGPFLHPFPGLGPDFERIGPAGLD